MIKKYIGIFIVGIVMGALWYRNQLPPFQQLYWLKTYLTGSKIQIPEGQKNFLVARYTKGSRLFIDRPYYDQIGDKRLEGLFLVQIPRHHRGTVVIKAKKPLIIYRLISESNDNSLFREYEKTNIKVRVLGISSTHTKVVKKDFPAGSISLAVGGPVATSPILITVARKLFPELGFEVLSIEKPMDNES